MKRSAAFKFALVALAALVGAAGLAVLHLENNRLRRAVAAQARAPAAAQRAENVRLAALTAAATPGAAAETAAELERARREVAELERRAAAQHAEIAARAARDNGLLATNRDPRLAPMRLEFFQERGRSTPGTAFESLVWAAMKGDEATLARSLVVTGETRRKAQALLARLPEDARGRWTPEKVAALWVTSVFNDMTALQLTGETIIDADEAAVTFLAPGANNDERVKLKLTPDGWKVVISSNAIDRIEKTLGAPAPGR